MINMESNEIIHKLTDNLLLSKYQVDSSGLYNGKVGIALGLFEAARYLHDDSIENEAFNLLQESLLSNNKDISFENGLSGIGSVFLYLIENQFIDADFEEIFKEHCEEIIKRFENIDKQPDFLLSSMKVIYFLTDLSKTRPNDKRIDEIVEKIFRGLELYLSIQFFDFKDIRYMKNKTSVMAVYETYLKLVDYSGYGNFSISLLNAYAYLYRSGRIASSVYIGYYLDKILSKSNLNGYEDVIDSNLHNSIKNIHSDFLLLDQQIDLVKLVNNMDGKPKFNLLPNLNLIRQSLEDQIMITIENGLLSLKYQLCLTRCLIYLMNKEMNLL